MTMRKTIRYSFVILLLAVAGYYFFPEPALDTTKPIDRIVVTKSKRELVVYSNGEALKTYTIALGREPEGAKRVEGDKKTPEGVYTINDKNPHSGYFLNLGISYPNQNDIDHARSINQEPGGQIKIHGMRNGFGAVGKFHRWFDWTLGCIAVSNSEMQELYDNVPIGTPIEIRK